MATFPQVLFAPSRSRLCTTTAQTLADIQSTPVHKLDTILIDLKSNFDGDVK